MAKSNLGLVESRFGLPSKKPMPGYRKFAERNVVDVLGKKMDATRVHCNIKEDKLVCEGSREEFGPFFPDWIIEVHDVRGKKISNMTVSRERGRPNTILIGPKLGKKTKKKITCMPRLGEVYGRVGLVCSEDKSELTRPKKDWAESRKRLEERGLKFAGEEPI